MSLASCPGYSSSGEDEDVNMKAVVPYEPPKSPDSQRPGAWQSEAYLAHSAADKAEQVVVPIELLYTWWCNGHPSADEFQGTFTKHDLRCHGRAWQVLAFFSF